MKGYDYARSGAYFTTICTQNRACLFGEIINGEMRLNDAGRMIEKWWNELNRKFPNAKTDELVVMPNHMHGIIMITVGADLRVCPHTGGAQNDEGAHTGAPLQEMIQWFKTMATNEYIRGVKTSDWPSFDSRLWQRNYYEHIIRNDNELDKIREYIVNNPLQWELDTENPNVGTCLPKLW